MAGLDNLLGKKTHVACLRRGKHVRIQGCWLCYGARAWDHATTAQEPAPAKDGEA